MRIARTLAAAAALIAAPAAAQEQSNAESLADQFEYALVAGDYRVLPLTEDFVYTENGAELDPWDGMWRTTTALEGSNPELYPELDYRVGVVSGETVVRVVEFDENSVQGVMAYKLVARDGQIASVDVLPIREEFGGDRGGTLTLLQPMLPVTLDGELLGPADPAFAETAAGEQAPSLHDIGLYFEPYAGGHTEFEAATDCVRRDNGVQVTNVVDAPVLDPSEPGFRPFGLGCLDQMASGFYDNLRFGRAYSVIDETRGLAVTFVRLDQPGTVLSFTTPDGIEITYPGPRGPVEGADTGEQFDGRILTNMITPMSINGVFIFKFDEDGAIRRIDAFYRGAPLGWDAVPD